MESSSSEPSPRDPQPLLESQSTSNLPVYPTNNRNIYSRHYPSLSSHGTQSNSRSTSTGVDTGKNYRLIVNLQVLCIVTSQEDMGNLMIAAY